MKKRKPKIHIVKRENFPAKAKGFKNLKGYQDEEHVYILKGTKDAEAIKHHEIYHYKKQHPGHPKAASKYIRQELEADMYAKQKIGMRKHIKPQIIAVTNDVVADYKLPPSVAIKKMAQQIKRKDIPKTWKQDFNHIMKTQVYKGRKMPKDIKIKEI